MTFSARTREKSAAIAQRWLAKALAAYPAESAAAFARQQDRFANPVGHALRLGTRAAVAALLEGQEPGEICSHLDEIVKIRAVQELQPSEAIRFVFLLKEALAQNCDRRTPVQKHLVVQASRLPEQPGRLHHNKQPGRLHHNKQPGRLHHNKQPGRLHHNKQPGRLHHRNASWLSSIGGSTWWPWGSSTSIWAIAARSAS